MDLTEKQKKRVESVFHEALTLPHEQREEYVAKVCPEDESVRLEAVSLLRHYESANDLKELGQPRSGSDADLPLPERIGPYEVLGRLGRGGMGEVYLARDPRLGRKVAVKVLAPAIVASKGAMDRLRREALAASALNHPNILTVHEFGEAAGTQYIVTEYVEGKSLRELIGDLSPQQAIGYARQIGEALAAAHKAGIIHRDIKPENVMVRPDGYVKVLDFGLAKAAPLEGEGTTSIRQKLAHGSAATAPGMLIGTISYMSPEQVRGQEVDQRTDVWSWGVVLYEMLTGRRPFEGGTPSDVVAAILGSEPELMLVSRPVASVLRRALAKKTEDRYPELGEALAENALLDHPRVAVLRGPRAAYWRGKVNRRRSIQLRWLFLPAAFIATLLIIYLFRNPAPAGSAALMRITNTGDVSQIGISPESNYVAYSVSDGRKESLRVHDLRTGDDAERVPPMEGKYQGIVFSAGFIYFVVHASDGVGKLYRVPMLSGPPKLIAEDVDSPIGFAPDQTRFAFMRMSAEKSAIVVRRIDSASESIVASLGGDERFWSTPLWSSDGNTIVSETFTNAPRSMRLRSIRLSDGQQQVLPGPAWYWLNRPAWKGKNIVVSGAMPGLSKAQLFEISLQNGTKIQLTKDLANYGDVDSSVAGHRIVAVQEDRVSPLWVASLDGKTGPRRVTAPGSRFYGVTWASDHTLISLTETGGRPDLWSVDLSTGKLESLTEDAAFKQLPEASPVAKQLIYSSDRDGTPHIWRSNLDGGGATRLTGDAAAEEAGSISPDGKRVVYTSLRNGFRSLRMVGISGGESRQITAIPALNPSFSPNGSFILCDYFQDPAAGMALAILQASDGKLVRAFPNLSSSGVKPAWSPDGAKILFVRTENGVSNIWAQPVDGGNPAQITHFIEDEIFHFSLSPDGKSLACVRGKRTSDAVVLEVPAN